ncbi:hypothetical protein A3D88_00705 [Candidatus Peribacteria bacterium RIFCSPHIGHO2_02_FULL_52_16]|nr:MAG: hypothetical protein A2706_00775 [Candidatus Peribacteria bacterium RIFCSPHIGHO2_01_FULL_51_35]OGJ61190.1 MAG: hypothetical protein A3D88_00705 [Candidatus Peribacteria bacterium RIFCSPHIGHO2_02_FULL_52_16]
MRKYYVYILLCSDDSYYTGVTNDFERRLREHTYGRDENCYTYYKRPVKLVYVATYQYILDAIAREKQIKGWSRQKKEALITKNTKALIEFSKRRKPFKKPQSVRLRSPEPFEGSKD